MRDGIGTSPLSTADLVTAAQAARALRNADAASLAAGNSAVHAVRPSEDGQEIAALFLPAESSGFRASWEAAQSGFVDDPKLAVQKADELVAEVMKTLADSFSSERARLESQVDQTDQVSTEHLRIALRRYRTFFPAPAVDLIDAPWVRGSKQGPSKGRCRPALVVDGEGDQLSLAGALDMAKARVAPGKRHSTWSAWSAIWRPGPSAP